MVYIDPHVEEQIIKLHLIEGRTYQSLSDEFGLTYNVVRRIIVNYRKSAQADAERAKQIANMEEYNRLKKENDELKKEIDFLKKAAAFFAKENK